MIEYDASTQESLKRILSPIRLAVKYHRFALYFVECSLSIQQNQYIAHLAQQCDKFDIILLQLDLSSIIVENLRQTALDFLHEKFLEQIPDNIALIITGLESSILLDSDEEHPAVLQIMNFGRDNYPKSFPHPFIICLSDKMLQKVQKVAPDFWSWRRAEPLRFAVTKDFLEQEIAKALSFNQIGGWNDAVTQVSVFERLHEEYNELYNNTDTELELFLRLGDAYRFLEKYQKAYNCYFKALNLAGKLGDSEKRATILNKLGIVMRETKDLDKAIEFFQETLKFAEKHEDSIGQGAALNNIGLIYLDKGEFSAALNTLEHALTINEKSNNLQALSDTLGNLGLAHYEQDNIGSAIEYYHQSLEISVKLDDQGSYWKDLLNLGLAHSEVDELETAFEHYSNAADVSHRAGDLIGEKRCLIHLAQCASLMGKYDSVVSETEAPEAGYDPIDFYERALEIVRNIKDDEDEYNILTALAEIYRDIGKQERAISYYEEAEKKAQELGDFDRELSCLVSLIQLHGRGTPDSVAKYKEQTKLILSGAGTLKTKMLNAWLVDDRSQMPSVLRKEQQYTLCLNIGRAPSVDAESEMEVSSFPIASVEFIYNIATKRPFQGHEVKGIAKPTEAPQPTTTGRSDVSVSVQPSDPIQTPISDSDSKSELAGDEHESQVVEWSSFQPIGGILSEKLIDSIDSEALIDIEVNIEGIGFDAEKSSDTLKASWEYGSDLLVFPVTPRELGKNELIIKCDANGIPFDIVLSVTVEESPFPEVASEETAAKANDMLEQYLHMILEEHARLHMIAFRHSFELKDIYVPPLLTSGNNQSEVVELELALANRRLVILGNPGTGKTILLRYLAYTYAEAYEEKRVVPIFVKLANLSINGNFDRWLENRSPEHQTILNQKLRNGECSVLLDGMDEVNRENWNNIRSEVERLTAWGNQVILSCRTAAYPKEFMPSFQVYEIASFNEAQQRQFIATFFHDTPEKAEALLTTLRSNRRIRKLMENPFLLSLLAVLYDNSSLQLPIRWVELQEFITDFLMREARAPWRGVRFYAQKKRDFLAKFAFDYFQDGKEVFDREDLLNHIQEWQRTEGTLVEGSREELLNELLVRNGILVPHGEGSYVFLHRTIHEYFTARYIASDSKQVNALVAEHLTDNRWYDIFQLVAGLMDSADYLLLQMEAEVQKSIQHSSKVDQRAHLNRKLRF